MPHHTQTLNPTNPLTGLLRLSSDPSSAPSNNSKRVSGLAPHFSWSLSLRPKRSATKTSTSHFPPPTKPQSILPTIPAKFRTANHLESSFKTPVESPLDCPLDCPLDGLEDCPPSPCSHASPVSSAQAFSESSISTASPSSHSHFPSIPIQLPSKKSSLHSSLNGKLGTKKPLERFPKFASSDVTLGDSRSNESYPYPPTHPSSHQTPAVSATKIMGPRWESEFAQFPSTKVALEGVIKHRGILSKHTPPAQVNFWSSKSSKVWKSVFCCITAIYPHDHPCLDPNTTLYNLHCFSAPNPSQIEFEKSRLRLEPKSIVCVLENTMAGESLVLKVTGHQLDATCSQEKESVWMFAMQSVAHLKTWMKTLKEIVNDLKSAAPPPSVPPLPYQHHNPTYSYSKSPHRQHSGNALSSHRTPSRMMNVNPPLGPGRAPNDLVLASPRPETFSGSPSLPSSSLARPSHHGHPAFPVPVSNLTEPPRNPEFQNAEASRLREVFVQSLRRDRRLVPNPSLCLSIEQGHQQNRRLSSLPCPPPRLLAPTGPKPAAFRAPTHLPSSPAPRAAPGDLQIDSRRPMTSSASSNLATTKQTSLQIRPATSHSSSGDDRTTTGSIESRTRSLRRRPSDSTSSSFFMASTDRTIVSLGPVVPPPTVALPPLPSFSFDPSPSP